MCLRRAPEKYIAGALAPAGASLDRADLRYFPVDSHDHHEEEADVSHSILVPPGFSGAVIFVYSLLVSP
jgi:hypothetical protein